jgi:quercetin dioxygenase-like cupin family protein
MIRIAWGCLILLAGAGAVAVAQVPAPGPTIVPVEREPQHRPAFENDVIAVLDVRFPPGYTSLFHTHSNDNVSVRIETGPTRTDTLEATGTPQTAVVGRLVFNSASPPYTHRVANVGETLIHILDIEVLAKTPTRTAIVSDELAGHEVVVENARVRLSRVTLAPGTSLPAHTHPRGRLEVHLRGNVPGAFIWRAPGSFAWREPGAFTAAATVGSAGGEWVEIEVK